MKSFVIAVLTTMTAVMAPAQCREVSKDFRYPQAPRELFHEEAVELRRLAGAIQIDLSDGELGGVLVELMDEKWDLRKRACLADNRGRFSLRLAPGLYYARFSKPGFVSVRIPVRIGKKGRAQLLVRMPPA